VAYDGTSYLGWQKTKEGPSIEEELEKVLYTIFQEPISLQASSRTDRGVHAEGQVVDFVVIKDCCDLRRLIISLNQLLPPQIRCRDATIAPTTTFHPTLDVIKKRYRYLISTGPLQLPLLRFTHWHVRDPYDRTLLHNAAQLFLGTHDFRGLCNRRADLNEEDTVRTVSAIDITEHPEIPIISIAMEADRFLYKMARNIVGTMLWVASKKTPIHNISTALYTRKRAFAGVTAPAHGLTLEKIFFSHTLFS
jgi:tRNA pseudouridine38-40 synthase